jgi:alanyl-tRNA synthetase
MALFGEKYGHEVRVIQFGESLELCGGTHAGSTGEIGLFKITSEGAIASGVRRIEAKTGPAAEEIAEEMEDTIKKARAILGNSSSLIASLEKIVKETEQKEKALQEAIRQQSILLKEKVMESREEVNNINLFQLKGEYDPEVIRNIAQSLRNELTCTAFIAASKMNNKPHIALMFTDDLVAKGFNASKEIKSAASLIKGGGGGQPSFATAGGKDVQGIDYAVERIKEHLAQHKTQ